MIRVPVAGGALRVRIDGREDAPPLLLSNSLATDLSLWDDQVPDLARHFRVVRYDSRGHGGSLAPEGPYAIDDLGRDALAVMDALAIARADFCGLSMGGMVGLWLLVHAPGRIGRAVLANTAAQLGPPDVWNARIREARTGGMAALAEPTLRRWFPPAFRRVAPDAMARFGAMIRATPAAGYRACCAALRDMDQRAAIRAVANPTLVVVGERDRATTPAHGRLIHAAIPSSRLVALDAGHLSNVEQPHAFTEAVLDFLQA